MKLFTVICLTFVTACITATTGTHNVAPPVITRVTGADMEPCKRWQVCGTDLGIPYLLENGSVGYLFGDTFASRNPEHTTMRGWRSPVMLRSNTRPDINTPIIFDSAAGVDNKGSAPSVMWNGKNTAGEFTVIPNDGVSLPEKSLQVISYQSVQHWNSPQGSWRTNYSGLAWSNDGNHFTRSGPIWRNNARNSDPFQMMSMQLDGAFIYAISVRAGRQYGPMVLQRVPRSNVLVRSAWQCWSGDNQWGRECQPLMSGKIGEPSLRKLSDGTWVMAYLSVSKGAIVTRTAAAPTGPWSAEQQQLTARQLRNVYGGFIHPYSTRQNVILMISTWQRDKRGTTSRYDVMQLNARLHTPVTTND